MGIISGLGIISGTVHILEKLCSVAIIIVNFKLCNGRPKDDLQGYHELPSLPRCRFFGMSRNVPLISYRAFDVYSDMFIFLTKIRKFLRSTHFQIKLDDKAYKIRMITELFHNWSNIIILKVLIFL